MTLKERIIDIFGTYFVEEVNNEKNVPLYFLNDFNFTFLSIYDRKIIFIEYVDETTFDIYNYVSKQKQIKDYYSCDCCLYLHKLNTHQKESLMKRGLSFITERGIVFIPNIGISILETKEKNPVEVEHFTPINQACAIHLFYNFGEEIRVSNLLALGYNNMAISRFLNLFIDLGILKSDGIKIGNCKKYSFLCSKKDYYYKMKPLLINPIEKRYRVEKKEYPFFASGYTALSSYTMISDNRYKTYAVKKPDNFKVKEGIFDYDLIEIWKYNPEIVVQNNSILDSNLVDPISLIATFIGVETDERTSKALTELEEGIINGTY